MTGRCEGAPVSQVIPQDVPLEQVVGDSDCVVIARRIETTSDHVKIAGTANYPVGRATLAVTEVLAGDCPVQEEGRLPVVRHGASAGVSASLAHAEGRSRSRPRPELVGGLHWDDVTEEAATIWFLSAPQTFADVKKGHRRAWRQLDALVAGHAEQAVGDAVVPLSRRDEVEALLRGPPRLSLAVVPPARGAPDAGPLHLVATLHNDGEAPLTVLRRASHVDLSLSLIGPDGPVSLTLPPPMPPPPPTADQLVTLPADGEVTLTSWGMLHLVNQALRSAPLPAGDYTVRATYQVGRGPTATIDRLATDVWTGTAAAEVVVTLQAQAVPSADP